MRRAIFGKLALAFATASFVFGVSTTMADTTTYLRYTHDGKISYGKLDGETVEELDGDIISGAKATGKKLKLSDVNLLTPVSPSKIICVGLNYKSHIGDRPAAEYPGLFTKFPSTLIAHKENIVYPSEAKVVHPEGEMVIIIGKRAKNVSKEDALDYVFGATIGNDVSERGWQRSDLQWFRAKAHDTFGPMGPYLVTGLDYSKLHLELKVNGETRQESGTDLLIFDVPTIVSYISQYVTLEPGDAIYTGTPGITKSVVPGDVIEVSLSGVGVLKNTVVKEK